MRGGRPSRGRRAAGRRVARGLAADLRLWLIAAVVLVAAACAPAEEGSRFAAVTERVSATNFPEPYPMPRVTLTDQTGTPFQLAAEAEGRIALLFFGYTNCPDICPITMANAAAALDMLEPEERKRVLTVFVTLDPLRDDPDRMAEWLGGLDPSFVGLTGSQEEVDAALAQLGFVMPSASEMAGGTRHEHGDEAGAHGDDPGAHGDEAGAAGADYEVAHPTALFVFTPDGLGRFGYGNGEARPDVLAADLRAMLASDW